MMPASWSPYRGLEPTPGEAREWLDAELNGSDYQDPWLESAVRWIMDQTRMLLDSASTWAKLSPVITVGVALVVIALLTWVLPKVRREAGAARSDGPVLEDLTISARAYRDLAAKALKDGRYDEAVLDGFRAIAKDMSDRTLLDDAPGRTAHEVSLTLTGPFPDHADRLVRAADAFDSVRYGHRRATPGQAAEIQDLDGTLVTTRPVLALSSRQDLPV